MANQTEQLARLLGEAGSRRRIGAGEPRAAPGVAGALALVARHLARASLRDPAVALLGARGRHACHGQLRMVVAPSRGCRQSGSHMHAAFP
jgi:hypothetical protein